VPVSTSTQRTLATHRLPKSHEHQAPQWPRRLATGPSLALATSLASSPPSTCKQHKALCQLMQHSTTSKRLVFTLQPCLLGTVLLPTGVHTCVPVHYKGMHTCAPLHYTSAHQCTPICFTGEPLCAPFHLTDVHKCAPVKPTDAHWCTLVQLTGVAIERALNSLYHAPMHIYLVGRRARMRAYH
jgi:hypothetical protein